MLIAVILDVYVPCSKTYDPKKIGGSDERVAGQLEHIESVAQWIPDMDAVLNIHDTPLSFVSAAHKAELEVLIEDGECEFTRGAELRKQAGARPVPCAC